MELIPFFWNFYPALMIGLAVLIGAWVFTSEKSSLIDVFFGGSVYGGVLASYFFAFSPYVIHLGG